VNLKKRVFVISLLDSVQRRDCVNKLLSIKNINFEFIDAIKGIDIIENILNKHPDLNPAEIGCFLSHKKVIEKIIEDSIDEAIIFEDDIKFDNNFINFYKKWVKNSNNVKFDILKLGYSNGTSFDYNKSVNYNLFTISNYCSSLIVRPIERTYGSFAYIITKEAASMILPLLDANIKPFDVFLQELPLYNINLYILKKQICFPDFEFDSLIRDKHTFLQVNITEKGLNKNQNLKQKLSIKLSSIKRQFIQFIKSDFSFHLK
jgi:glycosyl transferase family 25